MRVKEAIELLSKMGPEAYIVTLDREEGPEFVQRVVVITMWKSRHGGGITHATEYAEDLTKPISTVLFLPTGSNL